MALSSAIGRDLSETAAPQAIRAYVDRLRGLECPPEAVVVHIKRLLARSGPPSTASAPKRRAYYALREAAILFCIEEYFGRSHEG